MTLIVSVTVSREGGRLIDGAVTLHVPMPEDMPEPDVWALAKRHADAIRAEAGTPRTSA